MEKKNTKKTTLSAAAFTGAIIGILQLDIFKLSKDVIHICTSLLPFVIAGLSISIDWLFAKWRVRSATAIRTEKVIEENIKFLQKQIEVETNAGRDVSDIQEDLTKTILARSKLFKDELKRI